MGSRKGKEVASGKRMVDDELKTGRYKRKRTDTNRAVLQFFDDSAAEVDADDDDDGLSGGDSIFADDGFRLRNPSSISFSLLSVVPDFY